MAAHDDPELGFGTRAIHAGQSPDPTTGAVMTPVYYTSTYAQEAPGEHKGFEYSRAAQPDALRARGEPRLARGRRRLRRRLCFASGLAAHHDAPAAARRRHARGRGDDVYGGTFRLFDKVCHAARLRRSPTPT